MYKNNCECIPHFVYPVIYQWALGCFYLLAVVDNAAVNVGVRMSL